MQPPFPGLASILTCSRLMSRRHMVGFGATLVRYLLDPCAVRRRVVERPRQRVPSLLIQLRRAEPEDLDVARGDETEPPLASAPVAEGERVRLVDRVVVRHAVITLVPPSAIHHAALASGFLNGGVPQHVIELY